MAETEVTRPEKVRWAIKEFKPFKFPGLDGIYSAFPQMGLELLVPYLCKIYQACIGRGYIPAKWQNVRVVYLAKVGRVRDFTPKSYRPTSLSSFLLKTLERLIDRKIRDGILKDKPLSVTSVQTSSVTMQTNRGRQLISKTIEDKVIAMATNWTHTLPLGEGLSCKQDHNIHNRRNHSSRKAGKELLTGRNTDTSAVGNEKCGHHSNDSKQQRLTATQT